MQRLTALRSGWVGRGLTGVFTLSLFFCALRCGTSSNGGGGGHDAGPEGGQGNDGAATPNEAGPSDAGVTDGGDGGVAIDITMTINANTDGGHPISPYIYGVNDGNQAAAHHATIVRSGGNRLTAYDWENNASNAGADYHFQNDDYLCTTVPCTDSGTPGAYLGAVVAQAQDAGAAVILTVPIVDYVSADKSPPGDVRNLPDGAPDPNYLQNRFVQNHPRKGAAFEYPPDGSDGNVYQDEMVSWVHGAFPGMAIRWMLDNEPDLWNSPPYPTHPEVHPDGGVTYAEIAARNIAYASAIKAVVPDAEVWGPVSYGWNGYISLQNASDAKGRDFLTWWLGQMKAAAQDAGVPLVDGLDLHWYPEVGDVPYVPDAGNPPGFDCRITNPSQTGDPTCTTDAAVAAMAKAREQAPRSLWDPNYYEHSWIQSTLGGTVTAVEGTEGDGGRGIALIPRMQSKIAANNPGMKLSFTEWDYGGGGDISGGIATADVLGIFGAYGVDMAMLWPEGNENFAYAAYDIFRNYDGQGGAFGDTSLGPTGATTSDSWNSSIYASTMASDPTKMVLVVINKALVDKGTAIQITSNTAYTKAKVYVLTQQGGAKVVAGPALTATSAGNFVYLMPAQSVSVVVPTP